MRTGCRPRPATWYRFGRKATQPGITPPIVGPRTMAHLEDHLAVLEKTLDDADRAVFDELVHPGNAVANFHNSNEWVKARITG